MDKTIETKFFEAFKCGGVVDKCIDWMRYTYNLPPMNPRASTKEKEETPEQKEGKKKWDKYYRETLPKEILEATEAFDDSVIRYMDSPLMDEIEANLNDCQTDAQRERYLFSLLKPFGESPVGCGLARVYEPFAEVADHKERIAKYEKDRAFWQSMPEDEQLQDLNGKPSGTPKEQIKAIDWFIEESKEQIKWVWHVHNEFCRLTGRFEDGAKRMQKGTIEHCLSEFRSVKIMFANRLDALLLTYGIDLLRLQRESGLYLKGQYRQITDIACYIGSMELAQRYIDALPKEPKPEQGNNGQTMDAQSLTPEPQQIELKDLLPKKLKADEAVEVFQNAIDAQLITNSPEGLKWNDTKQLLAYFATKVSDKFNLTTNLDKDGNKTTDWKTFETLFKQKGLKGAKQNWMRLNTRFEPTRFEKVDALF